MQDVLTLLHVSLDGEAFAVRVGQPFPDGPMVYYPVELEHLSSTLVADIGPAEVATRALLDDYGFAEDLFAFYGRIFGRRAKAERFYVTDCVEPSCPAWYDVQTAGRLCPDGKPGKGPYYTGWQYPQDAGTDEDSEYNVHDCRTEDGHGHAGTPPR